ncbi:MAG: hypothetical protein GTO29_08835 [Candidatus Latescibacteria bacterium]|nr:hypothetical protein [Candidatus Latescibacterota bacterium]NIO56268.1 hypothetical protein [Candidatus Latescibacterota bacterium]
MAIKCKSRLVVLAVLLLLTFLVQCARERGPADPSSDIIDKYFDAIGGKNSIEAVDNLVIGGYYGNVFIVRGDSMTLYLKKPLSLRRESYGRVITYDGETGYMNAFGELTETKGDYLTSLRYYAGFFHNCFSLLKFGDALDEATYLGERHLGPQHEHVISIPFEGTDYEVHILADSFLVDRIVFPFGDPKQGTRMVNSLKNYKEFHGVRMPTVLTFDVVGREAAPMKLEVISVESQESLPDSLFEKPDIRIEAPTIQEGVITGFIYDDVEGNILTNVRREHMEELGIEPGQFMTFEVEGKTMSVRYVENIHTGFKGAQLGDYMAIYYQTPLLSILMFGEGALSDVFEFEKGQEIKIWATEGGGD